jgi:hypothetical protein
VRPKEGGKALAPQETVPHLGVAHLTPEGDRNWTAMNGDYYNNKDFQLWGTYRLDKVG